MIDLLKRLPSYERKSPVEIYKMQAIYNEYRKLAAYRLYLSAELIISTSVDYLSNWEELLSLPTPQFELDSDDPDYDIEYYKYLNFRRGRIRSRLRGYGTVTEKLVRLVCKSFWKGEVDVWCDYSNYTVHVDFVDRFGRPDAEAELLDLLRKMLPAHLELESSFTPRTWRQVYISTESWGDINKYTWLQVYEKEGILGEDI